MTVLNLVDIEKLSRMVASLPLPNISYSPSVEKRLNLIKQKMQDTTLKYLMAIHKTKWNQPKLEALVRSVDKITLTCACGAVSSPRVSDVLHGGSRQCRSCADKTKPVSEAQVKRLRAMSKSASATRLQEAIANRMVVPKEYQYIRKIGEGAKRRCTDRNCAAYKNYGGRGIKFMFASGTAFAWWVIDNLGHRPTTEHSIDRIDNARHYEPGNLRWATRTDQARNKRSYSGNVYGGRIQRLLQIRSDYTYEGIRKYIKMGWTDEQIIQHTKPAGGRPRKHSGPSL